MGKRPIPSHLPRMMTASEVAALFGVDHRTILKWARDGALPGVKPGQQWLFSEPVVRQVLLERKREGK